MGGDCQDGDGVSGLEPFRWTVNGGIPELLNCSRRASAGRACSHLMGFGDRRGYPCRIVPMERCGWIPNDSR